MADEPPAAASQAVFGRTLKPIYQFAKAKRMVSIDADFLQAEAGSLYYARDFAKGRRVKTKEDPMNRLYVAESGFTLTGSMADHRLRLASSRMVGFAAALDAQVTGDRNLRLPSRRASSCRPDWIAECAADLAANKAQTWSWPAPICPRRSTRSRMGSTRPSATSGRRCEFVETADPPRLGIGELAAAVRAGAVKTLFILGGNPVYNAPADLGWAELQKSGAGGGAPGLPRGRDLRRGGREPSGGGALS